jgi:hypothetical protein
LLREIVDGSPHLIKDAGSISLHVAWR